MAFETYWKVALLLGVRIWEPERSSTRLPSIVPVTAAADVV